MSPGSATCELAVGTRIGRYQVRRSLGMGGMGRVYAVWDEDLHEEVALKVLRSPEPEAVDAFKREFRALADLHHPNLLRLYELFFADGSWFFTMALVVGKDFTSYVRDGESLDTSRLISSARQLAEALVVLHDAGLVHRDIKADNVLIDDEGDLFLLDFGLARRAEVDDGGDVSSAGTLGYIAPEILRGAAPMPASDWYSFGVLLYRALAGRQPFTGTPAEIVSTQAFGSAPTLDPDTPDLPPALRHLCTSLLERKPEKRPSGSAVLAQLGHRTGAAERARQRRSSASRPFVGRLAQLRTLWGAFEASSREGAATVAHVRGPSGVGKSALLSQFRHQLEEAGPVLLLRGRCYQRESVPFKGFDMIVGELNRYLQRDPERIPDLLGHGAAFLAQLFPSLSWLRGGELPSGLAALSVDVQRQHAFETLRSLLAHVARSVPLVLALDDLQWVDSDTAALLRALMTPPAPPLLLLLSYRQDVGQPSGAMAALVADDSPLAPRENALDPSVRDIPVEPLPDEDGRQLALSLLSIARDQLPAAAETIVRESGGNAYFLSELAMWVSERRRAGSAVDQGVPLSLDALIRDRAAAIPEPAQRLLHAVAVAGRPIDPKLAVQAAELGPGESRALHLLFELQFLRRVDAEVPATVESYHDRIRETVVDQLDPEARSGIHRRLAHALESSGNADPELLAVHFRGAGVAEKAARYTVLAADASALQLAFDRAARLYKEALDLEIHSPEDRRSLEERHANALVHAGRAHVAADAYMAIARSDPEALAPKLRAADQLMRAGRTDEALDLYRIVLAPIGVRVPGSAIAAVLPLLHLRPRVRLRGSRLSPPRDLTRLERDGIDALHGISSGLAFSDPLSTMYFHCHHVLRALRSGDRYRAVRALAGEVGVSAAGGRRSAARTRRLNQQLQALAAEASNPAELASAPSARSYAQIAEGMSAFYEARWADAADRIEGLVRSLRDRTGAVAWEMSVANLHRVWALQFLGRTRAFRRELEVAFADGARYQDAYTLSSLRFAAVFRHLLDDDPAGAARSMEAAERRGSRSFLIGRFWRLLTGTQIDLYRGDPESAHRRFQREWSAFSRSLLGRIQLLNVTVRICRAGAAAAYAAIAPPAQARRALRRARRDARILRRQETPQSIPAAAAVRAALRTIAEDDRGAAELLGEAAEGYDVAQMQLHAASCRLILGRLRGDGPGNEMSRAAESFLRDQKVAAPWPWAHSLVPGFSASGSAR